MSTEQRDRGTTEAGCNSVKREESSKEEWITQVQNLRTRTHLHAGKEASNIDWGWLHLSQPLKACRAVLAL